MRKDQFIKNWIGQGSSYWTPPINFTGGSTEINNIAIPVYVHKAGSMNASSSEFHMGGRASNTFDNVSFFDENGNELKHTLINYGNYEVITDASIAGQYTAIAPDGSIYTVGVANGYELYKSVDGGLNYTLVYTSTVPLGYFTGFIFINSAGHIFSLRGTKVYKSVNGGVDWTEVLDIGANNTILQTNVTENTNGDLYFGRYQTADNPVMYKSTDDGDNWSVIYSEDPVVHRHFHGVKCDPYTGYIYAGLDGGTATAIIRSVDNGINWTELYTGAGSNAIGIYCGNGYRLFGGEDLITNVGILRTIDDITFTNVLKTGHIVSGIFAINNILFALGTTSYKQKYPAILTSTDGITWKTSRQYSYRSAALFQGHYLKYSNVQSVQGENIAILGNEDNLAAVKIYAGGNHYEALFYVSIPTLPTTGFKIKARIKASLSDIDNTFILPTISDLLLHYKLDEGSGSVITDSSGKNKTGALTIGTGSWNATNLKQIGSFTPAVKKTGKSLYFNGDTYITITGSDTDAELQITDNFSVTTWIKESDVAQRTIIHNLSGNYGWCLMYTGAFNQLIFLVGEGTAIKAYTSLSTDRNIFTYGASCMIGFIMSAGTLKFIINGKVSTALTITSPIVLNNSLIYIGKRADVFKIEYKGDIDDVRIYGKALSDIEVRSLYEENNILT